MKTREVQIIDDFHIPSNFLLRESLFKIQRYINPLMTNVSHHIENSELICRANQLTGFYVMENIGR